jgi:exonuclease VII large subunit
VFAFPTTVISAIGHVPVSPLVDWVAVGRASTPTDAARRGVRDGAEEMRLIAQARPRGTQAVRLRIVRELQRRDSVRCRPARPSATC